MVMAKKESVAARAAKSSAKTDVVTRVTVEAISRRAYGLFQAHGGEHGHDVEDWLLAEAELREGHSTDVASPAADKQGRLG
jgi:DUF2934 family protein